MKNHERLEAQATDKIWYYEDLFYNRIEIDKLIDLISSIFQGKL